MVHPAAATYVNEAARAEGNAAVVRDQAQKIREFRTVRQCIFPFVDRDFS